MDTAKELNSGQNASNKMENGAENPCKIRNPEVATAIEPEKQLDICKGKENVKSESDHSHERIEVKNDQQAAIFAQEDKETLCYSSLKKNRKLTYCETISRSNLINFRKCNKYRAVAHCLKRKTISLKRKKLLSMAMKDLVQENKSRIVDGDLKTNNDNFVAILAKSPFVNEVLYQPISINRSKEVKKEKILKNEKISLSFSRSSNAPDVQNEKQGNVDAGDTEGKSDSFVDLLKLPSIKVLFDPTSTKEVSTNENKLSGSSQPTSAPTISHDTTNKSWSEEIKSAEAAWANFISNLKTDKESLDGIVRDGVNRENAEDLKSLDHGFKDTKKSEKVSIDKSFGKLAETKSENAMTKISSDLKSEIDQTRLGTELIHAESTNENLLSGFPQSISKPVKSHLSSKKFQNEKVMSAEEVWAHFKLFLKANKESLDRIITDGARGENGEASESVNHSMKVPTKTASDSGSQNSGELVKTEREKATTEIPNDLKTKRSGIEDVTEFIHTVRIHFLNKILKYEDNLRRMRVHFQDERNMEKKIIYFTEAQALQKKIHTCFTILYDEQFTIYQLKQKLKSSSFDNNLENLTSLVDFPMSARRIQTLSSLFLYLHKSLYYDVPVENIFKKINSENYALVYEEFREQKVLQECERKELENVAFKLVVCFNISLEECRLEFQHPFPQFENNSLEDYQIYIDYLRIVINQQVKCLKELISSGTSVILSLMNYLCQSRLKLLSVFQLLDHERPDVFNCHKIPISIKRTL